MFCPECKSLMFPIEGYFVCRKCGYKIEIEGHQASTMQKATKERETLVIEGDLDTLPKTRVECPSCENKEAYWVIRQTRAADEPETRIYRCTKCGHTWREF
ncbi:DNA-directed RNA polymerase subunit M [candidate division WOR-1 bacterium DG_54_3]|uniref:DNA-directed RNA polymerase subunit M n=1 Tax=candidate division WOR-1 bacterium DG_54_3 TaxID=1703775 RepID=A0A0S7XQU1_UNCSA|nr:MAG: DNA-directed RNA polymerase subunit M [candidate division WOR-1 bacterium DG_54_3]